MNGYNFTERVRKVLTFAREEAAHFRHNHVGPEHILLGLLKEGNGVGVTMLQHLNVDPSSLIEKVRSTQKAGDATRKHDLPYTLYARKTLELAMLEARELNMSYVGTEHLLLGLIREGRSEVAQLLIKEMGNGDRTLVEARKTMLEILGLNAEGRKNETSHAALPTPGNHKELFLQKLGELGLKDGHVDLVLSGQADGQIKKFIEELDLLTAH